MAFFSWLKRRRRVSSLGREWVARYVDERGPVGHVWLLPHNEDYAPIPGDGATVLGKVVTVIRSL